MTRRPPHNIGLTPEKVKAALVISDGSPTKAAKLLGVTRNTIYYWMDQGDLRRVVNIINDAEAVA